MKTLEQVAEHFTITRGRIRQIQQQALEKMRERIEKRDPLSRRTDEAGIVVGG